MNIHKEYIYKIKNKQTLKLLNRGTTGVEIKRNRVRIMIEKGSEFKLEFEVLGKTSSIRSGNNRKWINPTEASCRYKGRGEINSDGICKATWDNADKICEANHARLPTLEELEEEVRKCGGKSVNFNDTNWNRITDINSENRYY